jgi:hypothetical protein
MTRVLPVSTVPAAVFMMGTGDVPYWMDWPIPHILFSEFSLVIGLRGSRSAVEIL